MISNTIVNTNGFLCCFVYQSPHETTVYFNDYNGHYHSAIYLVEGHLDTYPSDTETLAEDAVNAPLESGVLYDISSTKGKFVISKTQDVGAAMIMFNPVPADRPLDIQIVKDAQTIELTATDKRITVVCLTGPVLANDKVLKTSQYATIFPSKSATLKLEDNTICAIVTG